MPTPTEAERAKIKEICEAHGTVRLTAIADFIDDFGAYKFTLDGLPAYLKQMETEGTREHRFMAKDDSEEGLARKAFLDGNATAQGAFVRKYGMAAAKEAAERFSNPYIDGVCGKRGVESEADREKNGGNVGKDNPWSAAGWSITRQGSTFRASPELAKSLAAKAGSYIGATKPVRRVA